MKWPFSRDNKNDHHVEIDYDEEQGCHTMALTVDGATSHFALAFDVCPDPCCGCLLIGVVCVPEGTEESDWTEHALVFGLDVEKRESCDPEYPDLTYDPQFAEAVVAGMGDDEWNFLLVLVHSTKQEQMDNMDLDLLEPEFPPDVLEDDESLVGYDEIFPFAPPLVFGLAEETWVAADGYCASPKIKSRDTVLSFCRAAHPEEDLDSDTDPGHLPAICYNYRSQSFETLQDSDSPPVSQLVAALKEGWPDLAATLRERHRQIRRLYRNARRGRHIEQRYDSKPEPKVGRNDPCPCGSGKKFKRCCG